MQRDVVAAARVGRPEKDAFRCEMPVHEAEEVSLIERFDNARRDPYEGLDVELSPCCDHRTERLAGARPDGDGDVEPLVRRHAARIDGRHRWMAYPAHRGDLTG